MLHIGIDYGVSRGDTPAFAVMKKIDECIYLIDSGMISNFDYSKYVSSKHQIMGSTEDIEIFKTQFLSE